MSINNTTMTIRTNKEIKEQAQALFADLGMDLSTAVNLFLRQSVKEDALPFRPDRKEIPNRKTRKAIKNAVRGKNMVGPFKTTDELMEYLDA